MVNITNPKLPIFEDEDKHLEYEWFLIQLPVTLLIDSVNIPLVKDINKYNHSNVNRSKLKTLYKLLIFYLYALLTMSRLFK